MQQHVPAVHLIHDLLASIELDPDSTNQIKLSATFLITGVEQFDKMREDASHEKQEEIGSTATVMDPEEKVITNYVASHFARDSGICHAQIVMSMEEENQDVDHANN